MQRTFNSKHILPAHPTAYKFRKSYRRSCNRDIKEEKDGKSALQKQTIVEEMKVQGWQRKRILIAQLKNVSFIKSGWRVGKKRSIDGFSVVVAMIGLISSAQGSINWWRSRKPRPFMHKVWQCKVNIWHRTVFVWQLDIGSFWNYLFFNFLP